ncbi:phosphotyrosine protein phosphatase [Streptomyces sp. NPDC047976]|uniref:arsenate-mycothiol transferase ArsC n=1 Tax=Streptomyces sp. NPDC047976 TaxID=3155746 RepID=UPI0034435ADD
MPSPSSPLLPDERLTADRFDTLAHTQGLTSGPTRVLFVCSHNAGRSQMAAALLAHRAGDAVTVSSADTHPADEVATHISQALTEAGVDPADACPVVPGRRYLDWPVADPDGAPIAVVRDIRDAIDAHISELLTQLAP